MKKGIYTMCSSRLHKGEGVVVQVVGHLDWSSEEMTLNIYTNLQKQVFL